MNRTLFPELPIGTYEAKSGFRFREELFGNDGFFGTATAICKIERGYPFVRFYQNQKEVFCCNTTYAMAHFTFEPKKDKAIP